MKELINYLAGLTVTQGALSGEPFPVLPWEKRFLNGAFSPGVVDSALSVARGNGKTSLVAGLRRRHWTGRCTFRVVKPFWLQAHSIKRGLALSISLHSYGSVTTYPTSPHGGCGTRRNRQGLNIGQRAQRCGALVQTQGGRMAWHRL